MANCTSHAILVINTTFKGIALAAYRLSAPLEQGYEQEQLKQEQLKQRVVCVGEQYIHESHAAALKLPALVADLLSTAQLTWSEIKGIAVAHGPGSFTGIKIGIAFAQGLAAGEDIKLLGLDALACLTQFSSNCPFNEGHPWLLAQNRRKGYLYSSETEPSAVWLLPQKPMAQLWLTPVSADTPDDSRRCSWPEPLAQVKLISPWPELERALPDRVKVDAVEPVSLARQVTEAMAFGYYQRWLSGQLAAESSLAANYITPSTPEEKLLADQQPSGKT